MTDTSTRSYDEMKQLIRVEAETLLNELADDRTKSSRLRARNALGNLRNLTTEFRKSSLIKDRK